jgi:hypothetical protein
MDFKIFRKAIRKITRVFENKVTRRLFPYRLTLKDVQGSYCDPRELILYSVARAIELHVEDPWFEHVDWNYSEDHQKDYLAATHFYNWWKYSRPNRYDCLKYYKGPDIEFVPSETNPGYMSMISDPEFSRLAALDHLYEVAYDEEDQKMLKMIIDRRLGLWC